MRGFFTVELRKLLCLTMRCNTGVFVTKAGAVLSSLTGLIRRFGAPPTVETVGYFLSPSGLETWPF